MVIFVILVDIMGRVTYAITVAVSTRIVNPVIAFGAIVVLVDGWKGRRGPIGVAEMICRWLNRTRVGGNSGGLS